MNQICAEAGEDMRSYTSLMSEIHLHKLTESIAASTNIYHIFNSFLVAQPIPTHPVDSTISERKTGG